MPQTFPPLNDGPKTSTGETPESPHHGYQGDRGARSDNPRVPLSLTIALSREAGSRGGSIARRAGEKLGWQVYTQELLEYIAQEGAFCQEILDNLPPAAARWVEEQMARLPFRQDPGRHPSAADLAHMILALGGQGEVILIGRGAGCLLPARTTLHVRVVAPLADRIAYMAQWLRLTLEEAAEQVQLRDSRRSEFIEMHFHRQPADVYQYDLLLNSSLLGEELCADLIVQAVKVKLEALSAEPGDSPALP